VEEPFRLMREEFLPPLFERMFNGWPVPWTEEWTRPWGFEMEETEKEVVVRAELPGFEPAELEVYLRGELLTVTAEHKEAKGKEGEPEAERRYAKVRRSVTLPPGTETEKLAAVYRNGILEVRVPKTPEAVGRRVEVKT
jgi:HSP20 family protein